jgi:hypothetical protein
MTSRVCGLGKDRAGVTRVFFFLFVFLPPSFIFPLTSLSTISICPKIKLRQSHHDGRLQRLPCRSPRNTRRVPLRILSTTPHMNMGHVGFRSFTREKSLCDNPNGVSDGNSVFVFRLLIARNILPCFQSKETSFPNSNFKLATLTKARERMPVPRDYDLNWSAQSSGAVSDVQISPSTYSLHLLTCSQLNTLPEA